MKTIIVILVALTIFIISLKSQTTPIKLPIMENVGIGSNLPDNEY